MTGKEDWEGILPGEQNSNYVELPDSCSRGDPSFNNTEIFENGCFDRMSFVVSQSAMLVATGAVTVAFVQVHIYSIGGCTSPPPDHFINLLALFQLLGVVCAFMLAKTIRQAKSQRLARRWQLQQNLGIYNKPTPLSPYSPPYVQLNDETKPRQATSNDPHFTYLPNSPSVN